MCGISVRYSLRPSYKVSYSDILSDLKLIQHRGYDGFGIFGGYNHPSPSNSNPYVSLGHRRLSIIDISSNGQQPIHSSCGRYVMVFNGEIYNYKELASQFLGASPYYSSDTCVLLDLWALIGFKALPLLKGFFSVCILDNKTSQLYAFRDAFGIKPLWLHQNENFLHLCSEINPLISYLNHRSQLISPHGLACYLTFGYSFRTFPILQNVIPLQPGFLYCFSEHSTESFSFIDTTFEHVSPLKEQIINSTCSDVPVASFFSGGLDSSVIAAALKTTNISSAYCVNYQSNSTKTSDEYLRSSQNARSLGLNLIRVDLNSDNFFSHFDEALYSLSSPIDDSAIAGVNSVASRVSESHEKVLLGGIGGDELFCGYSRYFRYLSFRKCLFMFSRYLSKHKSIFFFFNELLYSTSFACYRSFNPAVDSLFSASGSLLLNKNLISETIDIFSSLTQDLQSSLQEIPGVQNAQMLFDVKYYLHDLLLLPFDNILMHHTLEGRPSLIPNSPYPYLKYKMPNNFSDSKPIIRNLLSSEFPQALRPFTKCGFAAPYATYVADNISHVTERIHLLSSTPFFTDSQLTKFIDNSLNHNSYQSLLRLYSLATWIFCN